MHLYSLHLFSHQRFWYWWKMWNSPTVVNQTFFRDSHQDVFCKNDCFARSCSALQLFCSFGESTWKVHVKEIVIIVYLDIPFSKNSHHIETSQLMCNAYQLTGFYMIQVFTGRSFWTTIVKSQPLTLLRNKVLRKTFSSIFKWGAE